MRISENFNRSEFACQCGCGFDAADIEVVTVLEQARTHFNGNPITITSGCRCSKHNKAVGGSARSMHINANAVDFKIKNIHADKVADYLESKYPNKYGIGRYLGRTHLDNRQTKARWDRR